MSTECKVILIGNLGKAPEVSYTQGGTAKAVFSIATSRRVKNGDDYEDRTIWHRVIVWGRSAENCGKYLNKGSKVYIDGELDYRTWEDEQSGQTRSIWEVIAHRVVFLSSKDSNGGGNRQGNRGNGNGNGNRNNQGNQKNNRGNQNNRNNQNNGDDWQNDNSGYGGSFGDDDDIPF